MAQITLPGDFKEFLRLLGARGVEYLLVGGYAVGHHGYPRYTADIDVWVPIDMGNAERLTTVFRDFGFDMPEVNPELFLRERMIIRMGVPPMRIEITNHIDGVEFPACYARRVGRRSTRFLSISSRWMISNEQARLGSAEGSC